jgi:hypothetical protein
MGSRITPQTAVQDANLWRDFRSAFHALVDDQRALILAKQQDRRLRACWNYDSKLTQLEADLVRLQLVCWIYSPHSGRWQLGEGPNDYFKAQFEALATRAGVELHPPYGIAPLDFWLHSLCLHLQETKSRGFLRADTGIFIEDVCQASATFCSYLEKKAFDVWPMQGPHPNKHENERESFVKPILDKKGWSILDWANEAGVDFHTASGYLKDTRKPYRSTRKKLAAPLGVDVEDLPK